MSDNWVAKHPAGMWTSVGKGEPPTDLHQDSKGTVCLLFDEDGGLGETREWNGRAWRLLTGADRERALDWLKQ